MIAVTAIPGERFGMRRTMACVSTLIRPGVIRFSMSHAGMAGGFMRRIASSSGNLCNMTGIRPHRLAMACGSG